MPPPAPPLHGRSTPCNSQHRHGAGHRLSGRLTAGRRPSAGRLTCGSPPRPGPAALFCTDPCFRYASITLEAAWRRAAPPTCGSLHDGIARRTEPKAAPTDAEIALLTAQTPEGTRLGQPATLDPPQSHRILPAGATSAAQTHPDFLIPGSPLVKSEPCQQWRRPVGAGAQMQHAPGAARGRSSSTPAVRLAASTPPPAAAEAARCPLRGRHAHAGPAGARHPSTDPPIHPHPASEGWGAGAGAPGPGSSKAEGLLGGGGLALRHDALGETLLAARQLALARGLVLGPPRLELVGDLLLAQLRGGRGGLGFRV